MLLALPITMSQLQSFSPHFSGSRVRAQRLAPQCTLCLETHIVPRYSTLTSCLHVSCLSAVVLGLDPGSDARKSKPMQLETEARVFFGPNHQQRRHRRNLLLMKPRFQCHVLGIFFSPAFIPPGHAARRRQHGAWDGLFHGFYGHSSRRTR